MWNSILFNEEQLHWVEDLPECYINIISLPEGEIFDSDAPWEPICVREIPSFLAANEQMNIWRSWDVFKGWKDNLQCVGPMPIVIDIDDEKENLQSAHRLSVACLTYLQQEKTDSAGEHSDCVLRQKRISHRNQTRYTGRRTGIPYRAHTGSSTDPGLKGKPGWMEYVL